MENSDDKIADALGMAFIPEVEFVDDVPAIREEGEISTILDDVIPTELDPILEGDFDLVRNNILEAIELGKLTLEEIRVFAKQIQSDKAYAALAAFFDKYLAANKALLEIHKDKRILTPKKSGGNTNVLILTTTELLHKLKEEKKKLNG
jgi:hypothetical protein